MEIKTDITLPKTIYNLRSKTEKYGCLYDIKVNRIHYEAMRRNLT